MLYHLCQYNSLRIVIKLLKRNLFTSTMAKSKFEYVKQFENDNICLPNCWIVVRVDGRNFSKFCDTHEFIKPNDIQALGLMNCAATAVMNEFREIILAFGQSDEYSFIFKKDTELYNRRESKLVSYVNSLFTSAYVFNWANYFFDSPLKYSPSFDGRIVLYPSDKNLRDYLSWRQADVHVNNLYNTCFWNLVQKNNMTCSQAQITLKGSTAADKNELLFQNFGINYNNERKIFRKGTTLIRKFTFDDNGKAKYSIESIHDDIIGDEFWDKHPELLAEKQSTTSKNKLKAIQNRERVDDNNIIIPIKIETSSDS